MWMGELLEHVARVVVVAPWRFEVICRSANKTDKNDANYHHAFPHQAHLAGVPREEQGSRGTGNRNQSPRLRDETKGSAHQ